MSSNPNAAGLAPGQPFVPYRRFHVHCVPEPLSRSRLVSAGAKLCYAALARYAGQDGLCFPRQEVLAAELAVSERQVRRYIRELEKAHLLHTTRRGLNDSNSYAFLWHPIFVASKSLNLQDRTSVSDQDRTYPSVQERTSSSDPFKEEETPLRDGIEETEHRSIEPANPKRFRHQHKRAAAAAILDWPSLDVDVIRRHLRGFRYSDGNPVDPTDTLVGRLLQVAKFYARTSFELAALLERKSRELENKPRWWPEKEDWFISVVDHVYAEAWLSDNMPPASAPEAHPTPEPDGVPLQTVSSDPEFSAALKTLAVAKKMR